MRREGQADGQAWLCSATSRRRSLMTKPAASTPRGKGSAPCQDAAESRRTAQAIDAVRDKFEASKSPVKILAALSCIL